MIVDASHIHPGSTLRCRLAVIGAGPAGIVTALEAARHGVDVVLLESGGKKPDTSTQHLSLAASRDPERHVSPELAVSRQIGGSSAIWGGRCVPYDPVDFAARPIATDSRWPMAYGELSGFFQRACDWMKCGRAAFQLDELPHLRPGIVPGLTDGYVRDSDLERWSLPTHFGKVYDRQLSASSNVRLVSGATCTGIHADGDAWRAGRLECKTATGRTFSIEAEDFVVAAGGLESTRLLMASPGPWGPSLGNHAGHLGRWYMAHLEGVIADIEFFTDPRQTIFGYERDIDGTYVRRRFTFEEQCQLDEALPNISGWLANPELPDASHDSAMLSLVYLLLKSPLGPMFAPDAQRLSLTGTRIPGAPYGMSEPSTATQHVRNLVRHPVATGRFIGEFGLRRVFAPGRKPPGFFAFSPTNRYPFQYHAEHLPHFDSRVSLSERRDALGMPMLDIDIKFSPEDRAGVIKAHRLWHQYLTDAGIGRLIYLSDDLDGAISARSGGGFHQIGTTRMSTAAADGVLDQNLAVHHVPNVHVVSSSAFVTSGQANSTFMILVLALRLIDHLYGRL